MIYVGVRFQVICNNPSNSTAQNNTGKKGGKVGKEAGDTLVTDLSPNVKSKTTHCQICCELVERK